MHVLFDASVKKRFKCRVGARRRAVQAAGAGAPVAVDVETTYPDLFELIRSDQVWYRPIP